MALPTARTDDATIVTSVSAVLNGTCINDGGEACQYQFEYGLTDGYGYDTGWAGALNTSDTASYGLLNRQNFTTYHYRFNIKNGDGTSYGADKTFKTLAGIPTVTTVAATSVTSASAQINGLCGSSGGEGCQYKFQWGPTTSYGSATAWTGSVNNGTAFHTHISGLTPDTTYHFRAWVKNSTLSVSGSDLTFTTNIVGGIIFTKDSTTVKIPGPILQYPVETQKLQSVGMTAGAVRWVRDKGVTLYQVEFTCINLSSTKIASLRSFYTTTVNGSIETLHGHVKQRIHGAVHILRPNEILK
jgi:hypothetical protein